MPIASTVTYTKIWNAVPITFRSDGGVTVILNTILNGSDGTTIQLNQQQIDIPLSETAPVLDVSPTPGLTRRQDIAMTIYDYLIAKGLVTGTVS